VRPLLPSQLNEIKGKNRFCPFWHHLCSNSPQAKKVRQMRVSEKKRKKSKRSHVQAADADENPKEKFMKYETLRMKQPTVISCLIWPTLVLLVAFLLFLL
jgi:hypothetical protein